MICCHNTSFANTNWIVNTITLERNWAPWWWSDKIETCRSVLKCLKVFYMKLYVHSLVDKFQWFYKNTQCYNNIYNKFQYLNGSKWIKIGSRVGVVESVINLTFPGRWQIYWLADWPSVSQETLPSMNFVPLYTNYQRTLPTSAIRGSGEAHTSATSCQSNERWHPLRRKLHRPRQVLKVYGK